MEYNPKDTDVIHLLKKLKDSNGAYPQEMLASRRQVYLKQVTEVSGAAGLAMGLKNAVKNGSSTGSASVAGTVVEALLVVAILAEAGAAAYFYRDKVAEFFQSISNSPRVEQVTEAPVAASPIPVLELTPTSAALVTTTLTETATATGTPSIEFAVEATQQGNEQGSAGNPAPTHSVLSTPNPNDNENNGNQYGLTPKPERTKEPGNDVSNENRENHNDSDGNDRQNDSGPRRNR